MFDDRDVLAVILERGRDGHLDSAGCRHVDEFPRCALWQLGNQVQELGFRVCADRPRP